MFGVWCLVSNGTSVASQGEEAVVDFVAGCCVRDSVLASVYS